MRGKLPLWARTVLAAAAAVLLPGLLKIVFRAELSWLLLLALVWGRIALSLASIQVRGGLTRILRLASTLYTVVFALIVLSGILISPDSAYGIWFETVRDGEPRGLVSNVMVLLAAVFSSSLAQRFLFSEFLLPVYGQILIAAGLFALIYQNRLFTAVLLGLLALGSALLSVRYVGRGNRLRNLVTFLLLFLVLLGLSRLPVLLANPGGNSLVSDRLHPGLRKIVVDLFPRFPLLYGVPGFGYGFSSGRLGGKAILSEAPIFEIQGRPGQRLYLRTNAYTSYDGNSWSRRSKIEEFVEGLEGTLSDMVVRIEALHPDEIPDNSVRITVLAEYYSRIPFTVNTQSIYLPQEHIEGISGNFEEGYQLANPLRYDQSIYLRFWREAGQRGIPAEKPALSHKRPYLQLPSGLSPRLVELAADLSDPAGNTRGTLRNIERHLAANCSYNLEAARTPAGADFVYTFLFQSKEGYCVHFASSFVVLARMNGIPTRYATGYLATVPTGSFPFDTTMEPGRGVITGLSAHAWPEVWLQDRGWTPWEATTAVNPAYYDEIGEDWLYEYDRVANRLTNRQLRAILGREPATGEQEAPGWASELNWQLPLLSIPILAFLLIAIWTLRRYGILLLVAARANRTSAMQIVAKITAAYGRRGVAPPWTCGWNRWIEMIDNGATGLRSRPERLLRIIQRLVYSNRGFRKLDLCFLRAFYLEYCARLIVSRD